MSRSLYVKLHRRFGPKLSGAERYESAHVKQTEFMSWLGLAAVPSDCARFTPNGVAIVGGGFAGLAAAWTLGQVGVASTVFEARKTYGGRVESDRSLIPGRVIEAGAEFIGLNHPMWLLLAKQFGLGLTVVTGEDQYAGAGLELPLNISGKAVPDPEKLYEQMTFVFQKISNDAKAITDPFAPWVAPGAAALDAKSVADKITEFARLLPRPHPLLIKAIELQLVNDHVIPAKEQSYLGLLALVSGGRMGKRDVNLEGYWNDTEEFRCAEGNDRLAGMMLEFGKRVLFRPSSPVTKIEISETDPLVKVTWFDSMRGNQSKDFDYVILTAPPSVWKEISITPALPPGQEMGLGPAVKYISQVHDRFWIKAGMAPSGASDELGETWEATENQALASRGIALSVFAGGTFVPKTDSEKHFEAQILKLYPGYRMKTSRYVNWPYVEWIKTGYACPKVGQVNTIGKFLSAPHRNRLYFAGEHTCMAYFGFMEGALQSGARAAKAILASCSKKSGMGVGRERFVHEYPMATERIAAPSGLRNSASSNDMGVGGFSKSLVHSTDQAIASGKLRCSADLMRHLLSEARLVEPSISIEVWDELPFSEAGLFDAFTSDKLLGLRTYFNQFFEVVASPRSRIEDDLHPGDLIVCRALAEGNLAHVALIVTGEALRVKELASWGLRPESWRPGLFVEVIEAGPFPHCREDKFARRVGDENRQLSHDRLILRISAAGRPFAEMAAFERDLADLSSARDGYSLREIADGTPEFYEDNPSAPRLLDSETAPPSQTLYVQIDLKIVDKKNNELAPPYTGIFIPQSYKPQSAVDLILYLHGHKGTFPGNDKTIKEYWDGKQFPFFALREGVNNSGKNLILVAPTLGPKSETGILTNSGELDKYLDQVMAALKAYGPHKDLKQDPKVGSLILACHSGGGSPMLKLAKLKGSGGYADNIVQCWGFDSLYANKLDDPDDEKERKQKWLAGEWADWANSHQDVKLFVYYYDDRPRATSEKLKKNKFKHNNVCVLPSTAPERKEREKSKADPHFWVPIAHWSDRLNNAPCKSANDKKERESFIVISDRTGSETEAKVGETVTFSSGESLPIVSESEMAAFEYSVEDLGSATTDYSLREIADGMLGKLPDDSLTAILTRGESDAKDLTDRVFWQKHSDLSGKTLDPKDPKQKALRDEWSRIFGRSVKPIIWLRQIIDQLDRHRGDIPREFLLGWMAAESDGQVSTVSTLGERGYFQIMWQSGEAKSQLGLTEKEFLRLSANREFSIEKGVQLAQTYRQHFLQKYPSVPDGSDLLWRLTKGRHALPTALDKVLDGLVKAGATITWQAVSRSLPKMASGVDRTLDYAAKLQPLADLVPGSTPPARESIGPAGGGGRVALRPRYREGTEDVTSPTPALHLEKAKISGPLVYGHGGECHWREP